MLVMIRKLIGTVYSTSKKKNTKKPLKLHRRLDFGRRDFGFFPFLSKFGDAFFLTEYSGPIEYSTGLKKKF